MWDEAMPCLIRKILGTLAMKYIQDHTTNQYNIYIYHITILIECVHYASVSATLEGAISNNDIVLIIFTGNFIVLQAIASTSAFCGP